MKFLVLAAGVLGLMAAGVLWNPGFLPLQPFTARGVAAGVLVGTAGSMAGFLLVAANRGAAMARFQSALFGGMTRWMSSRRRSMLSRDRFPIRRNTAPSSL